MGALKKQTPPPCPPQEPKKKANLDLADNVIMKAEIERMRKLLTEKIKDPKLAKKAAMILADMVNQKD